MKWNSLFFFEFCCVFVLNQNIKMKETKRKRLDLDLGFNYVISSQNTTITLSDDYHCNSQIIDDIEIEFSNSVISILTRRLSLKPNIEDFRHFVVTSQFYFFVLVYNLLLPCIKRFRNY